MSLRNKVVGVLFGMFVFCLVGITVLSLPPGNLTKLYKDVNPAIVWIGAEYSENTYHNLTFLEKIFGHSKRIKNKRGAIKWQGTGFIINPDGLIATAGHVVEDTKTFQLQFSDGRRGRARFVYKENSRYCDVGLIQVTWIQRNGLRFWEWLNLKIIIDLIWDGALPPLPIKNLPYVNLADKIKIAEEVAIIGYPWGLQKGSTVTQGIVAALNRNIPFFGEKFMLHTDAASWPGNSGSAVFNMSGDVIGILVGGIYNADNYSLCTPAKLVKLALDKYRANEAMKNAS